MFYYIKHKNFLDAYPSVYENMNCIVRVIKETGTVEAAIELKSLEDLITFESLVRLDNPTTTGLLLHHNEITIKETSYFDEREV